jgi:hypothetical protein
LPKLSSKEPTPSTVMTPAAVETSLLPTDISVSACAYPPFVTASVTGLPPAIPNSIADKEINLPPLTATLVWMRAAPSVVRPFPMGMLGLALFLSVLAWSAGASAADRYQGSEHYEGYGPIDESLNAAEYLASEGNRRVVFGLRGMKTNMGDPHRNFVDFSHVPVVRRLTRMPVCIDPSHSVGSRAQAPDGLLDVFHVTAQGVLAGANMILVDFHPNPAKALVDGPQALLMKELPHLLQDVQIARDACLRRVALAHGFRETA